MRKVLVTGGAGFIGSHLTERLLKEGYIVTVLDNFTTGREKNIAHLRGNNRLQLYKVDIADFDQIAPCFRDVDVVFHIAALADIVPSIVHPREYYRTNVSGTMNVAEAARLAGVKKFLYTASSSCYGIPDKEYYPTKEEAPIQPQYPYALTKYLGEQTVLHWGRVYKMPVVSLRLFNVYGPRSRTSGTYGAVFGVFLAQKLDGKPFTVVGDGNQSRDFIYVADVVEAFCSCMHADIQDDIFNVGTGNPQTINELVRLLGGEKVHIPKRPGEPECTWADNRKIKRRLLWQPKVSFEEGVRRMLEQIDDWQDAPVWTPESIEKAMKDWFKYLTAKDATGKPVASETVLARGRRPRASGALKGRPLTLKT